MALCPQHHIFSKTGFFDASYRLPLIVRDPRPTADSGRGQTVEAFTEAVDVLPTLNELMGLEVPPQCDGLSLAPMLRQEGRWREPPPYWRTAAHFEFDFRGDAAHMGLNPHEANLAVLRTERYKYVRQTRQPSSLTPLFR